jgi:uncharacterized protein (TIGR03083 family)
METTAAPWIEALRHSHDALRASVEPLDAGQLSGPSYCSDWSIAQVLSHLGSGAEIFSMYVDAGLAGQEPPGRDAFPPIWEKWNSKSPSEQAGDALVADEGLVERLESLNAEQLAQLRLNLFGMDLDAAGMARMRLGEHAVHSWDVAVELDPAATLAPESVRLLIDGVGQFVGRAGKADQGATRLHVTVTGPDRRFTLQTGEEAALTESDGEDGLPELRIPAEAFIRLLYGRLDPDHTPASVEISDADLDDLRRAFPGF